MDLVRLRPSLSGVQLRPCSATPDSQWEFLTTVEYHIQQLYNFYNKRSDSQQNFVYFEISHIDFTVSLLSCDTLITEKIVIFVNVHENKSIKWGQ